MAECSLRFPEVPLRQTSASRLQHHLPAFLSDAEKVLAPALYFSLGSLGLGGTDSSEDLGRLALAQIQTEDVFASTPSNIPDGGRTAETDAVRAQ